MAIFSDLELEGIMNEKAAPDVVSGRLGKQIADRTGEAKKLAEKGVKNLKSNAWLNKKKADESSNGKRKITFKEDADGNITDCYLEGEEEYMEEKAKYKHKDFQVNLGGKTVGFGTYKYMGDSDDPRIKKLKDEKTKDLVTDLKNTSAVEIEKQKQEWQSEPGAKAGEAIGNAVTGGNVLNALGKAAGRKVGASVDKIIADQERKRKAQKEAVDWHDIYRSPEYTKAMNEFFDITDRETRKVLLAVNEADQNKVLVSLTSKLYDNVVEKVDDIDFGEIERSKGDIEKLPNFSTLHECLNNMARLLIEFKQDTKPVDTIAESVSNIIESKGIWTKAYAVNAELPMITYNTIVLAIIEATSYMVSMCVDFIKSPSQDTIQIMIDKSALTKSKGHLLFKNLESFNDAYRKGQVDKAMEHVLNDAISKKSIDTSKKNLLGVGLYTGGAVAVTLVGVAGLLFCIIPIIRELIFLFFYYRVRISEFFDLQADLLQVNAYNVENNRLDLTKEERKNISKKQMKVVEDFRKIARKIAVDGATAEKSASKDIKAEDSKKYKTSDVMDELPDSASSALF